VEERSAERAPAHTRLVVALEKVVFPAAGRYRFDLVAGDDVVPACSLFVGHAEASSA
jgi:hypothetical protein